MDAGIEVALAIGPSPLVRERTIDITTTGARSGLPRRMEIWFWEIDGHHYLASDETPRAWFANLRAEPRFTFHLKNDVRADLPATAMPIIDEAERRRILRAIIAQDGRRDPGVLEDWVAGSPLVEIVFDEQNAP